nr:restriction endonuclease subunit S [uncultured Flavobacterium sp.]
MREDWTEINYQDAVFKIPTSKEKLKQNEYSQFGEFPVVDQGKKLIGGYSNDSNRLLDCNLPVIIFGDHTKCVKLINFKFVPGADGTKILQPKSNIEPKYIYYVTQILVRKIEDKGYARHYQHIEKENLPLAPLPEQRAIVAKIEELFSDLDKGIADLKTAQDQLVIYRQAVLKKAFEGELTKEWREKQIKLPSDEELLQQIKIERQKHYKQQVDVWTKEGKIWEKNGEQGKKPTKPTIYKEFNSPVRALNLQIPSGWFFSCIGNTCSKTEYGSSAKSLEKGKIPVLRMGNMQAGKIDWSDLKYSSDSGEIKQYLLRNGDVLFNRTNSPELVGKTVQYKGEQPAIFAGYLIRLNHITSIIAGSYLNNFLNSHTAKVYGSYVKTDGVNQSNINGDKLSNYPIPICTIEEQHQIVKEIESRLSVCDKVEQSIAESLEKAKALRQSILKKAFEGTLLSANEIARCKQEQDYEPASALLAKIKAEKKKNK